jgi:hypothetical protein
MLLSNGDNVVQMVHGISINKTKKRRNYCNRGERRLGWYRKDPRGGNEMRREQRIGLRQKISEFETDVAIDSVDLIIYQHEQYNNQRRQTSFSRFPL